MTQKGPVTKCCQLVLTTMIMAVNTYTKIKLNIFPTPMHELRSFQSYDDTLNTTSSAVPEQKRIHGQDKFDFTFSLDSNLGVHSPYNPDFIVPPATFGCFLN